MINTIEQVDQMRVLVVDDSKTFRKVIEIALRDAGCEPDSSGTVVDAKNSLNTSNYKVCIIDYRLPDGLGTELCEFAKTVNPEIFNILISGYQLPTQPDYVDSVWRKPFDLAEMITSIRSMLP